MVLLHFGVLTAAQTGNTTLLAIALAQGHLAAGQSSAGFGGTWLSSLVGAVIGALFFLRVGAVALDLRSQ